MREIARAINAKAGGQFKICRIFSKEGTFHVASDVSRQDGVNVGVCIILWFNDTMMYSASIHLKGESFSDAFFRNSIGVGLELALAKSKSIEIRRIVIARDWHSVKDEHRRLPLALTNMFSNGCKIDLVEITRSGPDCIRMLRLNSTLKNKRLEQPTSGRFFKLTQASAVLCTTGSPKYKGQVGPAKTIVITNVFGDTSLPEIVTEMYTLSRITPYSIHPTRLPFLANRAAKDYIDGIEYPKTAGIHAA